MPPAFTYVDIHADSRRFSARHRHHVSERGWQLSFRFRPVKRGAQESEPSPANIKAAYAMIVKPMRRCWELFKHGYATPFAHFRYRRAVIDWRARDTRHTYILCLQHKVNDNAAPVLVAGHTAYGLARPRAREFLRGHASIALDRNAAQQLITPSYTFRCQKQKRVAWGTRHVAEFIYISVPLRAYLKLSSAIMQMFSILFKVNDIRCYIWHIFNIALRTLGDARAIHAPRAYISITTSKPLPDKSRFNFRIKEYTYTYACTHFVIFIYILLRSFSLSLSSSKSMLYIRYRWLLMHCFLYIYLLFLYFIIYDLIMIMHELLVTPSHKGFLETALCN